MSTSSPSRDYRHRKAFFDNLLTVYGRKPVLEALRDEQLTCYKLHLANSNRRDAAIEEMENIAARRDIPVAYHDRRALSRISRNGRQDQGVAADFDLPNHRSVEELLAEPLANELRLVAVDRITNPQNLGMIVRSLCASGIDGLLLPREGCAAISPLVIKASAGTLFRTPILYCRELPASLQALREAGAEICCLASGADKSLFDFRPQGATVYVLGNESEGVSPAVSRISDRSLHIPMSRQVESLNVAVTAALIGYSLQLGASPR